MPKKLFHSENHLDSADAGQNIDLVRHYHALVEKNNYLYDPSQLNVVQHLQELMEFIIRQDKSRRRTFFNRFFGRTSVVRCRHLYLYGGVGQGKSMLMDLFFATCPISAKRRIHFHAFMQEAHHFIHRWESSQQGDVMPALARKISRTATLLCFDEFHVTDIADAMIMERLFRCLFEQRVVVVMTSNRHPTELYQGGLLREQFLPFVDLLVKSSDIIRLTGKTDYRMIRTKAREKRYFFPLNNQAEHFVQTVFFSYSGSNDFKPGSLEVFGREIRLTAVHDDIVLTSFSELCMHPLGAADYLAIAARFKIVIMSGIPRLAPDFSDEARRFEILIDAIYENKSLFICSAEAPPREIYQDGEGAFEFKRTVSRLMEMQSEHYP